MTPADCQNAVQAFQNAYAAIQRAESGMISMPDGSRLAIPAGFQVGPVKEPGDKATRHFAVDANAPAAITGAVQKLAREVARSNAAAGRAIFFSTKPPAEPSVIAQTGIPVRATLRGPLRDRITLEVVTSA